MIKQVKLQYFRKHENLTLDMGEGIVAFKGANEQGKSSCIIAIVYALFGAKTLPVSLEETVTWGQPVAKLKVEVTLQIDGSEYTFSRQKSGAEVTVNGSVHVTGQTEVSNFAAELLGVDAAAAGRLMMASQGGIRGVLDQGSVGLAKYIEDLSGMDLFDRLIERMQDQLSLGSPAMFDDLLNKAQEKLAAIDTAAPDIAAIDASIAAAEEARAAAEALLPALEAAETAARDAWVTAAERQKMHERIAADLAAAEVALQKQVEDQAKAKADHANRPSDARIAGLKQQLATCSEYASFCDAYRQFVAIPHYPEMCWVGPKEEFEAGLSATRENLAMLEIDNRTAAEAVKDIEQSSALLRRQIVQDMTCPSCGQEIKDKSKILAKNAEIAAAIAANDAEVAKWVAKRHPFETIDAVRSDLADLLAVQKSAAPFEKFATQFGGYVTTDFGHYPPKLTWKGVAPGDTIPDLSALKRDLALVEAQVKESDKAAAMVEVLGTSITALKVRIETLNAQLAQQPAVTDLPALERQKSSTWAAHTAQHGEVGKHRDAIIAMQTLRSNAIKDAEQRQAEAAAAAADVAQYKGQVAKLAFNNNLLKKVRAARPMVGDKLWMQVLASVSTMFSTMRGEASVVNKGKGGFLVNGQAIESLSGSTLDLLGLSLRTALTRTFLPNCPFITLDEPFAAADADRTAAMLGFISSAGFKQAIIISHEDACESVADHLIQL
jgi:DNA repair exonuclease SbcCD ATPase subunit